MTTFYDRLVSAGCKIDHHESDLYVRHTDAADIIIRSAVSTGEICRPSRFIGNDGKLWVDVPFAYAPFWRDKAKAAAS